MSLRHSYSLLAPIYDPLVARAVEQSRRNSLKRLENLEPSSILVNGIGTGLDIPHLPTGHEYTGTDITPAMLRIARKRVDQSRHSIELVEADSMNLPFDDHSFDHVIMHLILAVVPNPVLALQEANRVLRPGGRVYIFDKFLKPQQTALFRRTLNLVMRHIATRTDVVFEDVLAHCSELQLHSDTPELAGGWFRLIELHKSK